jgi:hypothetical protein
LSVLPAEPCRFSISGQTRSTVHLTVPDLAIRFLRWAARLDHNALVLYEDRLAQFDLPIDPDGPDEQLASLIDQLDFV